MDVLRPQLIVVGGRCYRKNPSLNRDVHGDEEDEMFMGYDHIEGRNEMDDETCDIFTPIEETEDGYQLKMDIPTMLFKYIIGKKGETRRRIETETHTQLKIPKIGVEGPIVIKSREKKGIISAKTRIEVLIDTARQREPITHFLSIPVTQLDIQSCFHDFKSDVLRQCDGDRGVDGTIFQKPEKLHLTLGALVLLSQSEVQKALDVLNQCKDDFVQKILKEEALHVNVCGLEYMNDDPNNVDVLYAKLEEDPVLDKLQTLVDLIVERFVTAGLMKKEYDRVKLHITVMNSLFRKDPSAFARPLENKNQGRDREAFDAASIMKMFGKSSFGNLHVKSIHLSQLHNVGEDGYYNCVGMISLP